MHVTSLLQKSADDQEKIKNSRQLSLGEIGDILLRKSNSICTIQFWTD